MNNRIAELSPEKRALLLQKLNQKLENSALTSIKPQHRESNIFPLSFAQKRLWFLEQLEPGNSTYNICYLGYITGNLDKIAFENSFNEIIKRHETLRTGFATVEEKPVQIISPSLQFTLTTHDLQDLTADQQEQALEQLKSAEAKHHFNLAKPPLLRVSLIHLKKSESVVILTLHHIISDGWSMGILMQEFATLYKAFSRGKKSPLKDLSIQYVDFALWQNQKLQEKGFKNQLDYWREQLKGTLPVLNLPIDKPRPAIQTMQGAVKEFVLPKTVTQALKKLSQQQGVTLFMTLLTAFKILLYRYTGQDDILIGSPIANRNRAEIEPLIGFFVNTLVLRTNLSGNPSFQDLLSRVRQVTLDAYKNQDIPFEKLVDELQPERNLNHAPLFQVMFDLQNAQERLVEIPGLTIHSVGIDTETAKFDLSLSIVDMGEEIAGALEYSTDIFEATTIDRMIEHFEILLFGITANPQQPISYLPLLSQSEKHQLLVEFNDTQAELKIDSCIHHLFEQQVEKTPDAVAVVFEDQFLTYKELNKKANQLAHYLQKLGVKPEVLVGICAERSPEMLIAILGILKAGGAYIPLDPAYPSERISFMLEDSEVSILITQKKLYKSLSNRAEKVICIDENDWTAESQQNPISEVKNTNLAYIIYTSGSTGKPKGVMIEHRSLVNYIDTAIEEYEIKASDRILQFASISFDAAAEEIFCSLIKGATLVLRTDAMLNSIPEFIQICRQQEITVLDLPTAFWHQLTAEISSNKLSLPEKLRLVIIGGERAIPERLATWQQLVGQRVKLFNSYGPTETTIVATLCNLSQFPVEGGELPIGRGVKNVKTYILDSYLQPVPLGVPGELYIGGAGVARGYLNRPELTSEKFILNPFIEGDRLYKTGDLVRYLPNGEIQYFDRIDNQVKIRGFRIELGEIETALNKYPDIRETVVLAREDVPGRKRLVAYIVTQHQLNPTELKSYLKTQLPDYMIPSGFVFLEALPLNPNGKVDRRTLPIPDLNNLELTTPFTAPRTPIEETLVRIWTEVLGVKTVGVYDNFFELGGDSIISLQVIAKANQAGLQLTPKQLFQHQTIAELATVVNTIQKGQAQQGLVTGSVILTPIQHWFFEQNLLDPHHWNQSVLLEVRQPLDPIRLEEAVKHLLKHHDTLRLRFILSNSSVSAINVDSEENSFFSYVDLSTVVHEEHAFIIETTANDLQESLNLSTGPLIIVALFNLGQEQPQRLLIIIHHLVIDGVSWRILLEDLKTVYEQLQQNQTVKLPLKTTSFQQYAQRLKDYVKLDQLSLELDYWLSIAKKPVFPVPTDYVEGLNTVESVQTVSVALTVEETKALLSEIPAIYRTQINEVLLIALVLSWQEWTGKTALVLDLEGHGREEIFEDVDISRTVGWFTSIFPVYLDLEGATQITDIVKTIKKQVRAIPNRGFGYGVLRYLNQNLEIIEQLKALPPAQMSFNYLGQFDQILSESSLFAPAQDSHGSNYSLRDHRSYLLEINALVTGGQLQINWKYSKARHHHSTLETFAQGFIEALRLLINQSHAEDINTYIPSDFPDIDLTQEKLELVFQEIKGHNLKNIQAIYPLSGSQQGMLFETLSAPESGIHIEQLTSTLQGNLNLIALEKSWQRIIERHSIFRTAFIWKDQDQPLQALLKSVKITLQQQDWRRKSSSQQQQELEIYLQNDRRQGFNLSNPPLMRLAIFQIGEDTYQLVWTHHHILMDGWCGPLVIKEVLSYYQAFSQGLDLQLPPSCSYKNYIAWLKRQNQEAAQAFWQKTLNGVIQPTPLGIKTECRGISDTQEHYAQVEAYLPTFKLQQLESIVKKHHLTLNTLIQGIYGLLLSRYSAQEDVVFGITVSGRPSELVGIESAIGLFINTLPLRVKVALDRNLWEWLQQIQAYNLDLRQYEYIPTGQVHQWSEVPGTLPLYESILVFENYPLDSSDLQAKDLTIDIRDGRSIGAKTNYALTLLAAANSELMLKLVYNNHRFEATDIVQILEHFLALVEVILTTSEPSLGALIEQIPRDQIPKDKVFLDEKEQQRTIIAPRTFIESLLADIWSNILGLKEISINDNFFKLGGHSLLATQVMSRIRDTFKQDIPLRYLFESPTIADLAKLIETGLNQGTSTPPILPVSREQELPLSFAQERLWFIDQLEPNSAAYNVPSVVLLHGSLNIVALEQSFNEVVKRHEALRTKFTSVKGRPLQIIIPHLTLTIPIINLDHLPVNKRQAQALKIAQQEAQKPFNLAEDILLRSILFKLDENEHLLLLTMHHIISDAWSMGVLLKEITALYEAFCEEKPSPLSKLSIQYADFGIWQRQWLQGEVLQKQLDYWKKELNGKLPVLNFPDAKVLKQPTFDSGSFSFVIPTDLAKALTHLSHQENATLFMTLLAILNTLLYRYTGADDIVIGTDVANRNHAEIEPLIGFFVNILLVRTDLQGNPTFRQLLHQVRQKSLNAYAHQDLPFSKLVEYLQPKRKLSQTPLFKVLFVYQNVPTPNLEFSGLTLTPLEIDNQSSKFDLVLFVNENGGEIYCTWKYNRDLFENNTISQLSKQFETLIKSIIAEPDSKLKDLNLLTETEKMSQIQEQEQRKNSNYKKFKLVKPKSLSFPQENLIKTEFLNTETNLPLIITPNQEDIDLIDWAKNNQDFIESQVLKYGGILFRGFNNKTILDFEQFAQTICSELFAEYGDLPRENLGTKVYGSTPYPSDKVILFHNESSHLNRWPMKIFFSCVQPAEKGGETPIVDCRKFYQLLDPKIKEIFLNKQLMYVRNYTQGLDVSWQQFFGTTDKTVVENYCRQQKIDWEWKSNHDLKTKTIRPAITQHPVTQEWVFFNQIQLHHVYFLDPSVRQSLLSLFGEDRLPRNIYYGDGSPIKQSIIEEITGIYEQLKVEFTWEKGDILMLENMLVAHGRNAYEGNRKIVVAMGKLFS